MLKIKTIPQEFLKIEAELIAVSLFKDVIPLKGDAGYIDWILSGQISSLIKKKKVFGNFKETVLLSSLNKFPAEKILLIGFGKASNLTSPKLSYIFSNIIDVVSMMKVRDFGISVCIKGISDSEYSRIAVDMLEGVMKGFSKVPLSEDYTVKIAEEDRRRFLMLNRMIRQSAEGFKDKYHIVLEV
ncbi:MAG: hypothetical protein HY097_06220 [Nitrospinae bacterium]|nr:hypothetical protein [Nitrospinota bacterium]MBI3814791.1 hypothetical protein [Nitrospinota bacterium]